MFDDFNSIILFNTRICDLVTVAQCEAFFAPSLSTNNNLSTTIDLLVSYFHRYIEIMNHNEYEKNSNKVRRKFHLFIIEIILSALVIKLITIVTLMILNLIKLCLLITDIFS